MDTQIEAFTLINDITELPSLCRRLDDFLRPLDLAKRLRYQLEVAIEEVFTNIVSYAYDDCQQHEIQIALEFRDGVLSVRLEDDGRAFDPSSVNPPDNSTPLCDRKVGGLGIHMIKEMMDDISYQRRGEKNILILQKHISR